MTTINLLKEQIVSEKFVLGTPTLMGGSKPFVT